MLNLQAADTTRPNVILIMTDDQGIGDFGATGNRVIKTPHLDEMARGGAAMTTFYVSPVCSPTRACLMTGRYNYRTRVIDTWLGRSMMEPEEVTVAEVLAQAGYATGIFGKWHLGDCYPCDQWTRVSNSHWSCAAAGWPSLPNRVRTEIAIPTPSRFVMGSKFRREAIAQTFISTRQ